MNVSAVMELVTVIAFVVILAGGKQKRESGWRVLSFLLVVVAVLQCASMAIVVSDLWIQLHSLNSFAASASLVNMPVVLMIFIGIPLRQ